MTRRTPVKVLMIDDNEVDRYTYWRYLEQAWDQYEMHEAQDGQRGLTIADDINPDCVVLDLVFPGEYGLEILQNLVGIERLAKEASHCSLGVAG